MFKILVTITVLFGATCCYGTNPYERASKFLETVDLETWAKEELKQGHGNWFSEKLGLARQNLKTDDGDYVKLLGSVKSLSIQDPCTEKNMKNLRNIVEMGLKYDNEFIPDDDCPHLDKIVFDNIDESSNCISQFEKSWEGISKNVADEYENALDWLDAVFCNRADCSGRDLLLLAFRNKPIVLSELARLVENDSVKETIRTIDPSSKMGITRKMEAVVEKHVSGPCRSLTSRYDLSIILKPTIDFSLVLERVDHVIGMGEDDDELNKWASRYAMCELLVQVDKKALAEKMEAICIQKLRS